VFKYGESHSAVILREDRNNRKDVYIRVSLLSYLYFFELYVHNR